MKTRSKPLESDWRIRDHGANRTKEARELEWELESKELTARKRLEILEEAANRSEETREFENKEQETSEFQNKQHTPRKRLEGLRTRSKAIERDNRIFRTGSKPLERD